MRSSMRLLRRGCGIVGLPNIGKSTLFNAMTASKLAKTGNYPFCTINANKAKATMYDERLRKLAAFSGAQKIVDEEVDVADVAGLIEGASKGAGLGNKFLGDIRPVNVILHTVRCFEDDRNGFERPDPLKAIDVIDTELILADCEAVEKYAGKLKRTKPGTPEAVFVQRLLDHLFAGKNARDITFKNPLEAGWLRDLQLLSAKPVLFILNVDERSMRDGNEFSRLVEAKMGSSNCFRVCSSIEADVAEMPREERLEFLKEYGMDHPAAEELLHRAYRLLGLQSFFTVGPLMAHAWTTPIASTVRQAAGVIHTDFEAHFRRAKVMQWDAFIKCKNLDDAESCMKIVNEDHLIKDGDVFIVAHGAEKKGA